MFNQQIVAPNVLFGLILGGGVGDLIKIPAIVADVGLGYLVWSMARELGASNRLAWIGAFVVIVNPVGWIDSTLWGQVDSVGTVVMLLALREVLAGQGRTVGGAGGSCGAHQARSSES